MSGKFRPLIIVNVVLFLLFLTQAVTAVLMLGGWAGTITYKVHGFCGILMLLTITIHLIFNAGWIKGLFAGRKTRS